MYSNFTPFIAYIYARFFALRLKNLNQKQITTMRNV